MTEAESGGSLVERRRQVERARAAYEHGDGSARVDDLRPEIAASWDRCRSTVPTGYEHTGSPSVDDVSTSPFAPVTDLIDELGAVAESEGYVAAVVDAEGRMLWADGSRDMRRDADAADFVPGSDWSEAAAGTNAPGLAVATGRSASVFAGEHWSESVHDWVCYSSPVTAADGTVIGAFDLSSRWGRASELAAATVRSFARLAQARLATQSSAPAAPDGLRIDLLGHPKVTLNGAEVRLSLRQVEILAVLAIAGPCSLDELHARVYGDAPVSVGTLKSEVSHLRKALGGAIGSRPYSLDGPVACDVGRLRSSLDGGAVDRAVADYRGQLLPQSESPFLTDQRHHLDVRLRTSLLQHGSPKDLLRFADVHPHDLEVVDAAQQRASQA